MIWGEGTYPNLYTWTRIKKLKISYTYFLLNISITPIEYEVVSGIDSLRKLSNGSYIMDFIDERILIGFAKIVTCCSQILQDRSLFSYLSPKNLVLTGFVTLFDFYKGTWKIYFKIDEVGFLWVLTPKKRNG